VKDDRESRSSAILRENIAWFNKVGLTRLSPGAPVILVGTRWGNGDLFDDRLLEHPEEQWDLVNLAAIAEENDILGRRVGQPLWPERYSLEFLQQKRFEIGNSAFTCLYQGNPTAAEGVTFQRDHWQFWTVMPEKFLRKIVSVDAAVKTGAGNDYSAVQCWGKTETGYYLLASWRSKVEYLDLRKTVVEFNASWKPDCALIEDTSAGSSLAQDLLSTTSIPVVKITVTRDKESRAAAITPMVECGSVYLPKDATWLNDFLDEISQFPRGRHDDMVDCAVQALTYLRDSDSMLTGWIGQGSGAFALGDAATDQQKAQLQKFAMGGLPRTECPYFGAGAQPFRTKEEADLSLADAQKAALPGETRGQFNSARNLGPKAANKPKPCCPKCSNPNLAMCGEYKSCVCGWDSKQRVTA
jgi:predicted phage terminase large subunit-like protein